MDLKMKFLLSKLSGNSKNFSVFLDILGKNCQFFVDFKEINFVSLTSFEFVDCIGDLQQRLVYESLLVTLSKSCSIFSFEFSDEVIYELYEVNWELNMNSIANACIKIWLNNKKLENLTEVFGFIPHKNNAKTFKLEETAQFIQEISKNLYLNNVNFIFENEKLFRKNLNILENLKNFPLLEKIFCLKNFQIDESQNKITLNEPIRDFNYDKVQKAVNWFESLNLFNPIVLQKTGNFIFIHHEIISFAQSSPCESFFISPSKIKESIYNYSDFIEISENYSESINNKWHEHQISYPALNSCDFINPNIEGLQFSVFNSSLNFNTLMSNYLNFKTLSHKSLIKVFGLQETSGNYNILTEKIIPNSFEQTLIKATEKKKIKILKELTKVLIYCEKQKFYHIGLDFDNIFIDQSGEAKLLPNIFQVEKENLLSPEERVLGYGDKSECFRMGLLISQVYFFNLETDLVLENTDWIMANVPIYREEIQSKYSKIVQIISELTLPLPKYRLSAENLLIELENY